MTAWVIKELRPQNRQAVTEAMALMDATLGRGMVSLGHVLRDMRNHGTLFFLAAYAKGSAALVGAGLARVLDDNGYRRFIAPMPTGTLPAAPPSADNRRVGLLNHLAVVPSMRRHGLGRALINRRTAWLKERCTEAYALSWLHGQADRSENVLKAVGWEPVTVLRDCWKQPSVTEDWHCPQCGQPCRCPGLLMRMPRHRLTGP